jgi:hypothetical protein
MTCRLLLLLLKMTSSVVLLGSRARFYRDAFNLRGRWPQEGLTKGSSRGDSPLTKAAAAGLRGAL